MKPEDKTLEHLVNAWNEYQNVENKHPDDLDDFRYHLHALQNLLYAHKYKVEVPRSGMYGGIPDSDYEGVNTEHSSNSR